jgi:hypothetical protein
VRTLVELARGRRGRAAGIAVRTAHLGTMAVLTGGAFFGVPHPALRAWAALTAATGLALLGLEASHSRHWAYQGRGVLALLHVAALALIAALGAPAALGLALGVGAVGSHLPRAVRKWSLRHRCVVD